MSDDVEITIRCPRSDAPVVGALLMFGGTTLASTGNPVMQELGESLSDEIIAAATEQTGMAGYLAAPKLIAKLDPDDGALQDRFEVTVDD